MELLPTTQVSYSQIVPSRHSKSAADPGELDLIRRIRARAGNASNGNLRLGIGDDCALLRLGPTEELAVTTDLSIAGRHFQLDWHPPESIGHRTLARGLSDLAAMGARPVAVFLSLALPPELTRHSPGRRRSWIDRFFDGFFALADRSDTPLAGGDLAQSPIVTADIVLLGAVRRGRALLRSTAKPGDLIYVTGSLGGSAAGLSKLAEWVKCKPIALKGHDFSRAVKILKNIGALAPEGILAPHIAPEPRLAQGRALVRRSIASAAIDISDGLSTDLAHLCEESNVAAEVDAAALPIHPGATLDQALHGGEDYELLFTAPPSRTVPRQIAGVPITRIGRVVRSSSRRPQIALVTPQGLQPLVPRGWQHFAHK